MSKRGNLNKKKTEKRERVEKKLPKNQLKIQWEVIRKILGATKK